jgi:methylenetetrahydrofolate reductase (NADPH)
MRGSLKGGAVKIRDILAQREEGVSFEFFPPKTATGREGFMRTVRELGNCAPLFVSVTCSPGSATHVRTVNAITWIRHETDLTAMPHLTCIAATQASVDAVLRDYIRIGVDNILALRGDPPRDVPDVSPEKGQFTYARDLVAFANNYNSFSIAVAVYPEGHSESPDLEKDIEYTKMKVDAGADFAITQMFFDNAYFYDYMEKARKAGITIPVLPGIMPVTDCRKVEEFAAFCKATIPEQLRKKMQPYLDRPEEMKKIGIEHAVKQCDDLRANGVKYLHFYTMNRAGVVSEILNALRK